MAGFLYFRETTTPPNLSLVREWGLGYAFSKEVAPREVKGQTPNGRNGYIFADSKRLGESQLKLDMERQTWRKIPGKDVWVGYWKDAKPTPNDLARKELLSGYPITLCDGNEWRIPVVRSFDEGSGKATSLLPTLYDLDESGQLKRGEIQEAHRWLWELTEPAWQAMIADGDTSDQAMLDICCRLIGANYAVDVIELAGMLQVFSPQLNPAAIVSLALDYTTWQRWAQSKKKRLNQISTGDGSNTANGATVAHHATPQPVQTS